MLRNYLIVGVRALTKHRAFAAINIVGLAIGMAACLVILLYVQDQLSYDRFWPEANRVYQLQVDQHDPQSGLRDHLQSSPYAAGRALAKDFPEVETHFYFENTQPILLVNGEPRQESISKVDRGFLKAFPLDLVRGSLATALPDTNAVIVSQQRALAWFGTEDAVGRTITAIARGAQKNYRVTGVYRTLPQNSHIAPGAVALFGPDDLGPGQDKAWGWFSGFNYVMLRPGTDVASLNGRMREWSLRDAPRDNVGGQLVSQAQDMTFRLVPLTAIHLGVARHGPAGNETDRSTVVTFAILAFLILGIACANFVNLSTARASQRAREVALRKVLGASRAQLVTQFLAESVLIATVAMLLALAMAELVLPWLRTFLHAEIALRYIGHGDGALPIAVALTLLVGIAGGLYPAFYLSRFQPARVLKANKSAADGGSSGVLRNVLVVAQFAISIGLIVCTAIVYAQTVYARTADPGFRRTGVIEIDSANRPQVRTMDETVARELRRVPGVRAVARTGVAVNTRSQNHNTVLLPGRPRPLSIGTYSVGYDYFAAMGMRLVAGRLLSEAHALDDARVPNEEAGPNNPGEQALVARGMNVVVNEAAARKMGFPSPQAALGRTIRVTYVDPANGIVPATIVGVVGDTRFRTPHEPVDDMIFSHSDYNEQYYVVRVDEADQAATLARIEAVWKRLLPTVPFQARFAEDANRDLTAAEVAEGTMMAVFAILSVVVGCLGLFGLATFAAERRTKEIGIRKVLGARTPDIVRLLLWQFSRPVLIANLIAWPIAWWVMRAWLNRFDARVPLTPTPFLAAGLLALLIAIATIGGHAVRVARANPIRALRYE